MQVLLATAEFPASKPATSAARLAAVLAVAPAAPGETAAMGSPASQRAAALASGRWIACAPARLEPPVS